MEKFISYGLLLFCFSCSQEDPQVNYSERISNSNISGSRNSLSFSRVLQEPLLFDCDDSFDLVAGQTIVVGEVKFSSTAEEIQVTFITEVGWHLRATHLFIGPENEIPLNNAGNPQIGQFTFQAAHSPPTTAFTYTINRGQLEYDNELDCLSGIAIAAHAEAVLIDEAGDIIQEETAWGLGNKEFPGKRWGWYFSGCLSAMQPSVEISADEAICDGETTTLTFSFSGTAPFKLVYTDPKGNENEVVTSNAMHHVTVSEGGTYTVVSFEDSQSCISPDLNGFLDISVKSLPQVLSFSSSNEVICTSDDDLSNDEVELTVVLSGAAPFAGEINGEPFASEDVNYSFTASSGIFSIESLIDANGCSATDLGDEIEIIEECEDEGDSEENEEDDDQGGNGDEDEDNGEDDDEDNGEGDDCHHEHDYYNDYCRTHTSAFASDEFRSTCFREYGFNRWGWTNRIYEGSYSWDVYADAGGCDPYWGVVIGSIAVNYFDGTATISYYLNDSNMSWGALNAYIGYTPLPIAHGYPTIAPRRYPHHSDGCSTTTFSCPGLDGGPIYIIAHAEVILED